MTPQQLAKSGTEHGEQAALFCWAAVAHLNGFESAAEWLKGKNYSPQIRFNPKPVPELKWLHAIPNGGSRGDTAKSRAIAGGMMKAEGVKKGVADVCLPVKRGEYSGLYIEMKRPSERPKTETSKGGISDEQAEFIQFVRMQGFGAVVCYCWQDAAQIIMQYLSYKEIGD